MNQDGPPPRLKITITGNYLGSVIHKSGDAPFALYGCVQYRAVEGHETDWLVFDAADSAFDLAAAFARDLVELWDLTASRAVDPLLSLFDHSGEEDVPSEEGSPTEEDKHTLVVVKPENKRPRNAVPVLFRGSEQLRDVIDVSHEYKFQMKGTNLGIERWGWIAAGSADPPSVADLPTAQLSSSGLVRTLHAMAPAERRLRPTEYLAKPPRLDTKLSVAITPSGPAVIARTSNPNPKPVTVRIAGDQRFLAPAFPLEGWDPVPRKPKALSERPSPSSFIVREVDVTTDNDVDDGGVAQSSGRVNGSPLGPELFPDSWVCVLTVGGYVPKLRRGEFITIAPNTVVTRSCYLPKRIFDDQNSKSGPEVGYDRNSRRGGCSHVDVAAAAVPRKRKFSIRLRPTPYWWSWDPIDKIFGEGNGEVEMDRQTFRMVVPLMLESDDEVFLDVEGA